MASERPLLTIAIPTFNRAKYLDHLLSTLFDQVHGKHQVELVISDNASPDDTPSIVKRHQNAGLSIRYIRNSENIGPDRNILQCFELAQGKYVWIFADDDVIEPTGLAIVLSHLESSEYDLVYISNRSFRGNYVSRNSFQGKFKVCKRAEELARQVHVFFTFISGNIVNKDRISELPHPPFSELLHTNLVQLGWTYTALENHRQSLVIHDPLIAALAENTGGYRLFKVFGTNLSTVTNTWLSSASVKKKIMNGTLQRFFPPLILSSGTPSNAFHQENPEQVLEPLFGRQIRYWIFIFPLLRLPPRMGRIWLFLLRVFNKLDKMTGSHLL